MSEKSVTIIGAGLAGLAAGCYGRMNGYRTHIFEHHSRPGGVAAAWKRDDYLVDGGIHFLMGHRPGTATYELYRELGAAKYNRFLDMESYGRFVDEATGRMVEITRDLDRLASDLKAISPADAASIDDLIRGARAFRSVGLGDMGMSKPAELTGFMERLGQFWGIRSVFRYFGGKYAAPVEDYVKGIREPWLREVIRNLFLPEAPVWFILMILGMVAGGQMGLLESGCLGFVQAIERRYRELGGEVTYDATVEEIIVEQHQAVGIRLADGTEHFSDVVVSAADGYSTIFKMLGGRYVDAKIRDRYENWPLFNPTVTISWGAAREFAGEPWLTILKLQEPFTCGNRTVDTLGVRIFNYSDKFAPSGKTVVQAMFETEWDWWSRLHEEQDRYESEKARVAEEVLRRLDRHYPGTASQVEVTDFSTPYTTWRYTLNHRGSPEGWLPTPKAIMARIPKTLPGLGNFYMAGQWVMPGGGVPPCLYSGRHVIQLLCHGDGKPFVTIGV